MAENTETSQQISRERELAGLSLPIIKTGDEISDETANEVQRAALLTLLELNVPMGKFAIPRNPSTLVDLKSKDAQGRFTFPRFPTADSQIPIIIITNSGIYHKGREVSAMYEPENAKICLNLRKIHEGFTGNPISESTAAVLTTVEEIIHFVQDKYWNRNFVEDTSPLQGTEAAHDANPIEKEAAAYRQRIYDKYWPELKIKVRGL